MAGKREGNGQSRAAKKRQKKKAKSNPNSSGPAANKGNSSAEPLIGSEPLASKKKQLWDDSDDDGGDGESFGGADVFNESTATTATTKTTANTSTTTTTTTSSAASAETFDDDDKDDKDQDEDDDSSHSSYDSTLDDEMLANSDFTSQALDVLSTILHPVSPSSFFSDYFEKKPLHIPRNLDAASLPLLSKADVENYIRKHSLSYGVDLNVTNVVDGVRRTLDVPGAVAESSDVWSNFSSGCSVRLLCPQKYSDSVWEALSALEHVFHCMVGSNAYLTPKGAQGFAPHYDDVDVFILQQEGKKRWRVYEPESGRETLPRSSSQDYDPSALKPPVMDVVLGPGDMLYLPRGWIHQAVTTRDAGHSLHLTVSCMMGWSWCDYLEHVLPAAMREAFAAEDPTLRGGMPRGFLGYMGVQNDNDFVLKSLKDEEAAATVSPKDKETSGLRTAFRKSLKSRLDRVVKEAMKLVDYGADEMSKVFMSDRLPPCFSDAEKAMLSDNREANGEICAETLVRLARPGIARLVLEGDKAVVYHCGDNSRVYREQELSPLEFEADDAPTIEAILQCVAPMWIKVNDLPHPPAEDLDDKVGVVEALYDEGILAISQPQWIKEASEKKKK